MFFEIKQSINRFYNLILFAFSYWYSKLFGKFCLLNLPFAIHIETCSLCNLSCLFCEQGLGNINRADSFIAFTDFQRLINNLPKNIFWITLYFQGEPLLDDTIIEKIKYLRSNDFYVELSTNAQNISYNVATSLVNSGLNRIVVSMDGISQKTYEKYRTGGNIDNVYDAINNLIKAKHILKKKSPKIIVQFVVFRHNEHEIRLFKKHMKKIKVKTSIKSAQLVENAIDFLPKNKRFSRYKILNDQLILKKLPSTPCTRLWTELILLQNGQIAICCQDKNANFLNDNWYKKSINEIWFSEELNKIRIQSIKGKYLDICYNCDKGF